jgi:hypothetical protein
MSSLGIEISYFSATEEKQHEQETTQAIQYGKEGEDSPAASFGRGADQRDL